VEGLFNTGLSVNDGLGNLLNVAGGSLQFAFNNGAAYLETGTAYDLKITAQPSGQVCAITHGTGVASANMMAIKINCATVGLTTASLSDSQLQWGVQTPIKITMKTETGLPVSGALTCQTTDAEALLVAPIALGPKAMRLGTYKIQRSQCCRQCGQRQCAAHSTTSRFAGLIAVRKHLQSAQQRWSDLVLGFW
jgi:hypothetical protein